MGEVDRPEGETEWVKGGRYRHAGAFHPIRPAASRRPTFPIKGKDLCSNWVRKPGVQPQSSIDVLPGLSLSRVSSSRVKPGSGTSSALDLENRLRPAG